MALNRLNQRTRATLQALESILKRNAGDPGLGEKGATPLQLAKELYPEEVQLLEDIQAVVDSVPESIKALQPDEVKDLRGLAAKIERGKRRARALTILTQKILRSPENGMVLERAHAVRLADLLKSALLEDVQTRVHELREGLGSLAPGADGLVLIVTRAPYRFISVPQPLDEKEAATVEALYLVFDRRAWRSQPSDIETKAFGLAQERFRSVLATGRIVLDDGTVLDEPRGIPKCFLGDTLRDKLDWASEVSDMLQKLFDNFYLRGDSSPDPERFHVIALWAQPYAVEIVHFILAARNEIFRVMNPLFQSIGRRPYALVAGHEFPPNWVPSGSLPDGPPLMSQADLRRTFRRLREIGVNHIYPQRACVMAEA